MAPTLYYDIVSPPVRSVLLTARAIGLELSLKKTSLAEQDHLKPEYKKINPQHMIPTLVEEDGFTIWESHAIASYLVEKYGRDDSLYPQDIRKRATINRILHFSNGRLFEGLFRPIVGGLKYKGQKEITSEQTENIKEVYSFMESFLANSHYFAGKDITVADLCIVTNVTALSILVPVSPTDFPKLSSWLKKMEDLPYYEEIKKGDEVLYKFIKSLLQSSTLNKCSLQN